MKKVTYNKVEDILFVTQKYCEQLEIDIEGYKTEIAIQRKAHKEFCNDVNERLMSKTRTIIRQQEQIEDLKDTVSQLLDMIDEIKETGEINW